MEELVVKKGKFDDALAKIESESKKNENLPELVRFEEKGGLFSLFPKSVTGAKMNEFTAQLQQNIIIINNKINNAYKQFNDVYAAFESLDKEYISGIIGAFNQAVEASKKAEDAQKEVNQTVELLQKHVEKMRSFNKAVGLELQKLDSPNWKENILRQGQEPVEPDSKTESVTATLESCESQNNPSTSELNNLREEMTRIKRYLMLCWIATGIAFIVMILLILLAVFNVI